MRDNFLSAMRLLSTAAIGLLSVACVADDGDGKVVRTTSDAILGKADWKNIEMTDSSISIVGDTGLPIRWQKMELPNTFLELMAFENGSIRYQKVYGGLYLEEYESDLDKMRETYDFSKLRERYSLDFDESNVKRKSYGFGDIRYISLASESSGNKCVLFHSRFGSIPGRHGATQALEGIFCRSHAYDRSLAFEQQVLDLIGRLRFDGGLVNKARASTAKTMGSVAEATGNVDAAHAAGLAAMAKAMGTTVSGLEAAKQRDLEAAQKAMGTTASSLEAAKTREKELAPRATTMRRAIAESW